jgi:hypothetical protein
MRRAPIAQGRRRLGPTPRVVARGGANFCPSQRQEKMAFNRIVTLRRLRRPAKDIGGYLTSCRFGPDEECGMADPTKCKVHGPLLAANEGQPPAGPEAERARAFANVIALPFGRA